MFSRLNLYKIPLWLLLSLGIIACVNNHPNSDKAIRPDHAITKEQAITLINNYTARYDTISKLIGKEDNRSTWYSLDELKNYIAYAEAEGKKQGIAVNGIRFYIGAYASDDKNLEKQNLTTIFLAPTGNKIGSMTERSMSQNTYSQDIVTIDAYNFGQTGWPPHSVYPNN